MHHTRTLDIIELGGEEEEEALEVVPIENVEAGTNDGGEMSTTREATAADAEGEEQRPGLRERNIRDSSPSLGGWEVQ